MASNKACNHNTNGLVTILLSALHAQIQLVKTSDIEAANDYGINRETLPVAVYFENGIPSIIPGM